MRIAIIEDSDISAYILMHQLERVKFNKPEINYSKNTTMSVQKILNGQFDLVFMDIHLGNRNGIELVKLIRDKGVKIPILMMTCDNKLSQVLCAMEAGANGYLLKPINPVSLVAKLQELFPEEMEIVQEKTSPTAANITVSA